MRRVWAWLKHYLVATPEESARYSAIDDELR